MTTERSEGGTTCSKQAEGVLTTEACLLPSANDSDEWRERSDRHSAQSNEVRPEGAKRPYLHFEERSDEKC